MEIYWYADARLDFFPLKILFAFDWTEISETKSYNVKSILF